MKNIISCGAVLLIISLIFFPMPNRFAATLAGKMVPHVLDRQIHLRLPMTMRISENSVEDQGQLQYSAYLNDEYSSISGYIQIWELSDLNNYLRYSKAISTFDFFTYTLNDYQRGDHKGILNIWGASFGESKISGKEYWLKLSDSKVIRIAFLTNQINFSDGQLQIINSIISSLKLEY